jgi:hypothetical protein
MNDVDTQSFLPHPKPKALCEKAVHSNEYSQQNKNISKSNKQKVVESNLSKKLPVGLIVNPNKK